MTVPSYDYAVDAEDELCIADPWDSARMLCGRWRLFLPMGVLVSQRVHGECLAKWRLIARRAA